MAETAWQPLTDGTFHSVLHASRGVALVLLTAPSCSACKLARRVLPGWLHETVQHFYVLDVAEHAGIAKAYEVFHLPALFLFRDGRYHARLEAELKQPHMLAEVARLLAAEAQEEP